MTAKKDAPWQDLPEAGIITDPGNAAEWETGSWRSNRPVWDEEECIDCLNCWIYCPDSAILIEDGAVRGIDYRYCKGCGICVEVKPKKPQCLKMVPESEFEDQQ